MGMDASYFKIRDARTVREVVGVMLTRGLPRAHMDDFRISPSKDSFEIQVGTRGVKRYSEAMADIHRIPLAKLIGATDVVSFLRDSEIQLEKIVARADHWISLNKYNFGHKTFHLILEFVTTIAKAGTFSSQIDAPSLDRLNPVFVSEATMRYMNWFHGKAPEVAFVRNGRSPLLITPHKLCYFANHELRLSVRHDFSDPGYDHDENLAWLLYLWHEGEVTAVDGELVLNEGRRKSIETLSVSYKGETWVMPFFRFQPCGTRRSQRKLITVRAHRRRTRNGHPDSTGAELALRNRRRHFSE